MSLSGTLLQLAYRLRRHVWAGWPLSRWLGLLLVVAVFLIAIRFWAHIWPAVLAAALYLVYLALLAWASRRGYVAFKPLDGVYTQLQSLGSDEPLRPEELVPARASGWFAVEGQDQYYVDLDADFETVALREHIVLARVHASRFLGMGRWPRHELGWWYIFFQPSMIQSMDVGRLHFGARSRAALRLVYAPDEDTVQTVYLAFEETKSLKRVWDDVVRDAPPSAVIPAI